MMKERYIPFDSPGLFVINPSQADRPDFIARGRGQ